MDSGKAAFEKMMNVAAEADLGDSGLDEIRSAFTSMFGEFDMVRLMQKPEVQRLISSDLMRDAVEVSEMPGLQMLYLQIYEEKTLEKSFNFGFQVTQNLMLLIPILILALLFSKHTFIFSLYLYFFIYFPLISCLVPFKKKSCEKLKQIILNYWSILLK